MRHLSIFRTMVALAVITAFTVPYTVHAQETQFKIGVVNLKEVFDGYDKQKKLYEDLQKERDDLQKPIDALSKTIEANKAKYDDKTVEMLEADRVALREKIEADFSEYKLKLEQSQNRIDRREKSIFEEVIADIQKGVEEIGAKENYHLIFDGAKSRNNNLLYSSTTLNMTQKVIDHLNSKEQ